MLENFNLNAKQELRTARLPSKQDSLFANLIAIHAVECSRRNNSANNKKLSFGTYIMMPTGLSWNAPRCWCGSEQHFGQLSSKRETVVIETTGLFPLST